MRANWKTSAAAIAAMAMAIGPAHAQEGGSQLGEEEVSGFFETMKEDVTEAVESGDYESLLQWTEDAIADEATFMASSEMHADGERKSFSVVSLDKEDMTRLGQIAVGVMAGMGGGEQAIEDYSLDIEVGEVTPMGADAATVQVSYTETATLAAPSGGEASPQDGEDAGAAPEGDAAGGGGSHSLEVQATADCSHVIRRGDGDTLLIGLSACQARSEL